MEADQYLAARTGCYEWRSVRYAAARDALAALGLSDGSTVVDVGAGWTELDYHLRTDGGWRGRYIPVDACIDGVDLAHWVPPRRAEFFVALEVVEHLERPYRLLRAMKSAATRGVIVSTPNPATTNVLGMDPTHRRAVPRYQLEALGFRVRDESFYGDVADSLFAWWTP